MRVRSVMTPLSSIASSALSSSAMNTCTICSSLASTGRSGLLGSTSIDDAAKARMVLHQLERFLDRRR